MKESFLSDWTLVAFKQREEERRRKERDEAARVRSNEEKQRGNEILRSEWTVLALQKRFVALEQRLTALEQREEERCQKEQPEPPQAARPLLPQEKQRSEEVFLSERSALGEANIKRQQAEAIHRANERGLTSEEAATVTLDKGERLQRDRMKVRPLKEVETVRVGVAHKMLRGLLSLLITASLAGAIGFGIGVYVVPIEQAAHFHAMVERSLDSIHETIKTFQK